jgi:tetratricopeptide (TPR) repeat protein
MTSTLTDAETNQLLRTVEMFEAITDSQPDDYQSLEILKEAYNRLGRRGDCWRVTKKLAKSYYDVGQISQAILEYEGILQDCPDDAEVKAALAELEAKTCKLTGHHGSGAPSLVEDSKPKSPAGEPAGALSTKNFADQAALADRQMANVLITEKILTAKAADPLLQRLQLQRHEATAKGQTRTLAQLMVDEQLIKMEDLLVALIDKSQIPYLPLSCYDVDRDIACLLPRDLCFSFGIIPFDIISRSILIATSNPFNSTVTEHIRSLLDYNPFWYVTAPTEINTALRAAHGFDSKTSPTTAKPASS